MSHSRQEQLNGRRCQASEDLNFESLLETEPMEGPSLFLSRRAEERWLQGRDLGVRAQALEDAARRVEAFGYDSLAEMIREMKLEPQPSALDSAAGRIKDLEGVLMAVKAGIVTVQCHTRGMWNEEVKQRQAALSHIVTLINETLGACYPDEETR